MSGLPASRSDLRSSSPLARDLAIAELVRQASLCTATISPTVRIGRPSLTIFGLSVSVDVDLPAGTYRARWQTGVSELRVFASQPIPPGCFALDLARDDLLAIATFYSPDQEPEEEGT